MTLYIFIRYLHFLSIIVLSSAVTAEHLLLKKEMSGKEIYRLSILDSIYGISAIVMVASGLSMWFWVGKPADFYTYNGLFHLKVGLAILMGIISILPTVFFFRNRKKETVVIPAAIKWSIRLELLIIISIPLLAALMAQGIGYSG